jgi:MULE transposase domain
MSIISDVTPVSLDSAPLIITLTSNLTPDEMRNLLFDIDRTLEIPMETFNDKWWPLVSNIWTKWDSYNYANGDIRKTFACRFMKHRESSTRQENIPNEKRRITKIRPSGICSAMIKISWIASSEVVKIERYKNSPNHAHSLSEVDRLKRPKVIRSLVEIEAVKNYSPPAITSAIKEYAMLELGLGECARKLKRKEVANIKYKVRGPTETHLIGNSNLELDISESVSYLTEQGYLVETYRVSQRSTKGIVFAHPEQLKKLERHGWLTLMDSTHKTNRYDWRLFTLYVRDTYGCWNVGAHFFVSNEDADTVAQALTIIRNMCCRWSPRYVLSDHSNIEAKSIKKTFPGISAGEQECEVLLCVVHVMRTWIQKIHEKKTRDTMVAAMHKRTKIGCEGLVQDAINRCSVPTIQNYIKRNYAKNTEKWGLWACQHSPLLLQVTSTNSLESFHSELKKKTSSLHGLIGA